MPLLRMALLIGVTLLLGVPLRIAVRLGEAFGVLRETLTGTFLLAQKR